MVNAEQLITDNIDVWAAAIKRKNTQGRGASKKTELYGIKKLRELILELAVRGLLVPQDPNDEPASVLLKKIAEEKALLLKDGKIKKQKNLSTITDEEKPFELPKGWEWERLGKLSNYGTSDKAEPSDVDKNTWVLELEDVEKETSRLLIKKRFYDRKFRSSKNRFFQGDVIYGKLRPYLDKVIVADEDGVCTTEMIPVRAYIEIMPEFLRLTMKSPYFKNYANNSTHGMNLPRLGTDKARLALIPLCSLPEQHRIVAKVDELMALCDQLEQHTETSLSAHQTLVETLLGALTATHSQNTHPARETASGEKADKADATARAASSTSHAADNARFTDAWQRIAAHFDTLFTTEHSIDQLKQTILQLAVMGKLVPQDPNDEPASELLKKIAAEKARLVKEGKIKKQKPLPPISDEEKPFELPGGWVFVRLQDVTNLITDGKHGDCNNLPNSGYYFLSAKDIQNGKLLYENARQIVSTEFQEVHQRTDLEPNDICMVNTGATVGKIAIATDNSFTRKTTFQKSVAVIKPTRPYLDNNYLANYLISETPNLLKKSGGSAINNLLLGDLKKKVFLLPPIEEQKRIIAKVDELMAICDQLKARLIDAQSTELHLADAMAEQAIA